MLAILILFIYNFSYSPWHPFNWRVSWVSTDARSCTWRLPSLCGCQSVCLSVRSVWHCLTPTTHQGSQLSSICDITSLKWLPRPLFSFTTNSFSSRCLSSWLCCFLSSYLHSILNSATEVNQCLVYDITSHLTSVCFIIFAFLCLCFCFSVSFSSFSYSQHIITDILTSPPHN